MPLHAAARRSVPSGDGKVVRRQITAARPPIQILLILRQPQGMQGAMGQHALAIIVVGQ
jgi:hypothetical protein